MYKVNASIDGERHIFQVYYVVFARDSKLRPRRKYVRWYERNLPITAFKYWPFANDFRIETDDEQVLFALCKYCSKVEYNDFMRELRSRNIKCSALIWMFFLWESATCIHRSKFARHVGTSSLGRTEHVHCFQTQLTERCLVAWFWVDKKPACCFFLYVKQSGRFWVDGEWNRP